MKTKKIFAAAVLLAFMATFTGCAARVGVPPPVLVSAPPPPVLGEIRPAVPFFGAVWINGYYEHRHNRYHWVPGRYVRPPHRGAHWVPGRWNHHRRGWGWHKGYWK